ncbi:DedA family protein [Alicyclobacillus fastidiosus]|uniref:DedA family protein n=1 Tax=Alicyclobacillus fastidiosus TaxID=392011 RepID=A0ABY6ZFJ6_9BACL|nr:DedA family protein [Alicyclobacillus fastidiosus]WAH40856.1 DedA family protein [Alicyclobacillus fastidiosus]GMA62343.1 membrane protein [Alicyclobacillus fastidiosus]
MIQHLIHQFGYFGVFLITFIEAIGFPFPAETTLTLSGIEWTHGVFRLVPLWAAGALGNIVGSTIAYGIGRYLGRPIVLYFGKYIGITPARLDKANEHFQRYEYAVLVIAKFIAGIRILVPYLAGINRMRFWIFWPVNALSAIVWSGAFIIAGHYIGALVSRFWPFIHRHMVVAIIVACLLVAAFVYHKIRGRRRERELAMSSPKAGELSATDELGHTDQDD